MLAVEMERKEQDQWETVTLKDLLLLVLIICTYVSISEYQELELVSNHLTLIPRTELRSSGRAAHI